MNAEQIRNMEAGHEMDALVAETVMELDEVRRQVFGPNIVWASDDRVYEVPHYSTDIAAAWEVVEKIATPAPHVGDNYLPPNTIFAKLFDSGFVWAMSATGAAESICKWALLAVMGDES